MNTLIQYTLGLTGGLLIWALLANAPVMAQRPVSLSEAIELTLERNFDIQIEEQRSETSRNNNAWGAAGRYPTITLQLNSNNRLSTVDNPASFINGNFSSLGATGTVNAAWNIFSGFRVNITKARLDELERLSDGNVAVVIENSLQAVILQYYACLVEEERFVSQSSNINLSRDRYHYVKNKKDLGTGTTFELLNVQNAYFADSTALLQQELALDNSFRRLSQLIGLDPTELVRPSDALKTEFPVYEAEVIRSKMFANNLTLKNQFINLEILQKDIELAHANKYPAVSLNLGSTYSLSRFDLEGRAPAGGNQLDYYANFSLNFTLYNGGNVNRSIENALVNQRVAEIGIDQMEQSMDYQLVNAIALYDTRRSMLQVTEKSLELAQKNLEIAEVKFKNGTLNSFNYRDVQTAYLTASLTRSQALYNMLDAEVSLVRLTGGILDMQGDSQ